MGKITKLKRHINKALKDEYVSHCWYNTYLCGGRLDVEQMDELHKLFEKNERIYAIVVGHNIEGSRPQRTWGSMPEYVRPETEVNHYDDIFYDNSLVLVLFKDVLEYGEQSCEDTFKSLIKSFPEKSTVVVMYNGEKEELERIMEEDKYE